VSQFSTLEEEDDFSEMTSAPEVKAATHQVVAPVTPEFAKVKVHEFFHRLVGAGFPSFVLNFFNIEYFIIIYDLFNNYVLNVKIYLLFFGIDLFLCFEEFKLNIYLSSFHK